ncbi:ATP-binding cassette sub-family G member 1-like [Coccinella septempunctata]|uniref:ATP-binding cassette sub-family G member 1-like n=1 Tax=Coccinella septempunctata TaxID=41139 RepID=UPI001D05D509|nr:ATP-binding cassette sub-family G member 1-like [Coccinella septempunctata]
MACAFAAEKLSEGVQCDSTKPSVPHRLNIDLLANQEEKMFVGDSVASLNEPMNVGFENVSYRVAEGFFNRGTKLLLNGVSGECMAGELTAIMGPSGAGKSTLMNILAGYTTGATGQLLINKELRHEDSFRRQSCYIMQNDQLQPLLTVMESMNVAANLKMSTKISQRKKKERIEEILHTLTLWEHRKVRTQSLSGGQRKRLSIALELLKNPQIMFFDEPTSGLDSMTSKQCVSILKDLASTGRTIICTIHQPSALIFEMFDHLYVLARGHCVYQGAVRQLLPYLSDINLICPPYHNPADFVLEVAAGDLGDHFAALLDRSANGTRDDWREIKKQNFNPMAACSSKTIQQSRLTPLNIPQVIFRRMKSSDRDKTTTCCESEYATSSLHQLLVLIKRNYIILSRDRTLTYSRIATHVTIALFIGYLYYGIGIEAQNMLNNFNYMYFSVMFLMMTAFNCVSTTFPSELPIISKEYFNKWYSLKSYFLAVTLADVPIQVIATLLYSSITYILTKQPTDEPYRIAFFMFMCVLVSLVAQSFGLLIGASMNVKNGVIFGPFCFLPFTIFSGFFVQYSAAHPFFRWIFHISFLKYGLEGLVLAVLGYGRGKLPCEADYCHYVHPRKFLRNMDMDTADYWLGVSFMICLIALIRIGAFCALSIQVRSRG